MFFFQKAPILMNSHWKDARPPDIPESRCILVVVDITYFFSHGKWFFFERGKNGPSKSPTLADKASVLFVMIQTTESLR